MVLLPAQSLARQIIDQLSAQCLDFLVLRKSDRNLVVEDSACMT